MNCLKLCFKRFISPKSRLLLDVSEIEKYVHFRRKYAQAYIYELEMM